MATHFGLRTTVDVRNVSAYTLDMNEKNLYYSCIECVCVNWSERKTSQYLRQNKRIRRKPVRQYEESEEKNVE